MLLKVLNKIDEGYSEGYYNSKKYGMTKTTYNKGKSIKFYAAHCDRVVLARELSLPMIKKIHERIVQENIFGKRPFNYFK